MKFLEIESTFVKFGHHIRKCRTFYDFSTVLGPIFALEKLYTSVSPRELGRDKTLKRCVLISCCVNLCPVVFPARTAPSLGHCVKQQFFS